MQPDILQVPGERRAIPPDTRSFIERVREGASTFGLYPPDESTRAEFEAWQANRSK